jgi:hypothetical protein
MGLIILAAGLFAYSRHERNVIHEREGVLFHTPNAPGELDRIRADLSQLDLTRDQLAKELDGRMAYLQSLQGEEFYLTIDSQKQRMEFRLGRDVVRQAAVEVGAPRTIKGSAGKMWTFVPLKGGFNVEGKEADMRWRIPEWVYAMNGGPTPSERPSIAGGLGKYVISLPNNYVIHSPPAADSPLHGAKPGSFMVPEADLAAIWPRITTRTRVYVF